MLGKQTAGRCLPPLWSWLAELVFWLGGEVPLKRFLRSLAPFLPTEHALAQREALGQFQQRLAALQRRFQTLQKPTDDGGRTAAARRRQIREAETPIFLQVISALEVLPGEVYNALEAHAPRRSRELSQGHFDRLREGAEALLARLGPWPDARCVTTLATVCVCDGSDVVLPAEFVLTLGDERSCSLSEFCTEAGKPGYDAMLRALNDLPPVERGGLNSLRCMIGQGATVEDVRWAIDQDVIWYFDDDSRISPAALHRICRLLEQHSSALSEEQVYRLCEQACSRNSTMVPEALARWMELVPPGRLDRAHVQSIKNLLLSGTLGSLRGVEARQMFERWAEPPKRVPHVSQLDEAVPKPLRQWVGIATATATSVDK